MSNTFGLLIYLLQFTVKLYEINKTKMLLRNSWEPELKQVQVHQLDSIRRINMIIGYFQNLQRNVFKI